jgi:DtxR family Mn-dependent transcriptional regulator
MHSLTPSKEDYIKTVYELTCHEKYACITDVAARMEVTKASASRAVSELEQLGLVMRGENRRVRLTAEGREEAYRVINRFETLRLFFYEVLQMNDGDSEKEACKLEHLLSDESLLKMQHLLNTERT